MYAWFVLLQQLDIPLINVDSPHDWLSLSAAELQHEGI